MKEIIIVNIMYNKIIKVKLKHINKNYIRMFI